MSHNSPQIPGCHELEITRHITLKGRLPLKSGTVIIIFQTSTRGVLGPFTQQVKIGTDLLKIGTVTITIVKKHPCSFGSIGAHGPKTARKFVYKRYGYRMTFQWVRTSFYLFCKRPLKCI